MWIKIEDKVPEVDQDVWYFFDIVGVHKGKYYGADWSDYGCGHEFGGDNGFLGGDVTHWMPCNKNSSRPERPYKGVR